jgi:hypothetical protein
MKRLTSLDGESMDSSKEEMLKSKLAELATYYNEPIKEFEAYSIEQDEVCKTKA